MFTVVRTFYGKIRDVLVRLLIFLATPQEDDRTAIWSIPQPLGAVYFAVFIGASLWTIYEIVQLRSSQYCGFVWTFAAATEKDCLSTWNSLIREVATEFAPTGVGIAIGTLIVLQGVALIMAIYQFLTNVLTKPVIERHAARGRAEADRLWREWNQRRIDAAANNLPFDEPPPTNLD